MKLTIEPSAFARIMSLPITLRHDVLEFLGSTSLPPKSVDTLVASAVARQTERRTVPVALVAR